MEIGKIFKNIKKQFKSHKFSSVKFNSKNCKNRDIFFAIKGEKKNGNKYIKDAIRNGAKTVISDLKFQGYKNKVLFLKNKNPRKLLSEFSSKIYKRKPNNLLAVTGTNGKSSIANFFLQILKINKVKVASIGTLGININNKINKTSNTTLDSLTLNKTLEKLKKKKIDNVILEASSHGLKQHRLDGIKFNIGIFTNLSRDHLDYHKSFKDYLKSKMILFNQLMKKNSYIIYDNNIFQSKILKKISTNKKLIPTTIGKNNSDLQIFSHRFIGGKQEISFVYKKKKYLFKTSLIGKVQIKNLLMAILAANKINLPIKKIVKSINKIKPVNGRLENIGYINNNSKVILDYAHTPDALKISLENIKEQFKLSKVSLVFGCGGERDKPKRKLMGKIANYYCDKIYLTDDNPRRENPKKIRNQIKKYLSKSKLEEIPSREKAISQSIKDLNSGDILVVAGRGHESIQEYKYKKFFSDKKFILKYLKQKNKILYKNLKSNIINEKIKKKIKISKKINFASINSKKVKNNDIFFGIKGKNFDGNLFANEAIKNGAALAIIDKNFGKKSFKKIKVKNTLKFLNEFSQLVRKSSDINAIAVTGSSGKTFLKELIGQSLNKIYSTTYSTRSFNNKYGVPLSLCNIKKKNIFGVFEVGMNKTGEINNLTKIIKPDLGVITNIAHAHIGNFNNLKEIASAKSEIIDNISNNGAIVLNKDDNFFKYLEKKAKRKKIKIITFGIKNKANINLVKIIKKKSKYILVLKINNKEKVFLIKENLRSYIYNILSAIAAMINYIEINKISKNIFLNFEPPKGRGDLFKIKYKNKIINIIDESYNSNPLSLKFAINNFNRMNIKSLFKNLLLGDMLELGKHSKKLHIDAAKTINNSNINKVFVYGKYVKATFNKIKTQKRGRILKATNEIYSKMFNNLKNNDFLMVKGSNATGLNKILNQMKSRKFNAL